MKRLAAAFVLGLLAAAVPLIATSGQCVQTTSEHAPRLLLLTSDESAHKLQCLGGSRIAFERVRSVSAANERLRDELVDGVLVDPQTNAAAPIDAIYTWASTGTGRVVFGLDLTHFGVRARGADGRFEPPDERTIQRGVKSFARVAYRECNSRSRGGGEGTYEYVDDTNLINFMVGNLEQNRC